MQDVLRQHERVQGVALVDRILVVRFELVERDNLKRDFQSETSNILAF